MSNYFRDMLRKAVNEQVAALMVLPNKFPVQLIQDVPLKSLKFSPPAVSNFCDFNAAYKIITISIALEIM